MNKTSVAIMRAVVALSWNKYTAPSQQKPRSRGYLATIDWLLLQQWGEFIEL
jgi:hypothetical protein